MKEPTIQQRSYRLRVDLAIIPCSEEHDSVEPVRRYVDMTVPGDQVVFRDGNGNVEIVNLVAGLARQATQSAVQELMLGRVPKAQLLLPAPKGAP